MLRPQVIETFTAPTALFLPLLTAAVPQSPKTYNGKRSSDRCALKLKAHRAAFLGPFLYPQGAEQVTRLWIYRSGPPAGWQAAAGLGQRSGNTASICCHGLLISAC